MTQINQKRIMAVVAAIGLLMSSSNASSGPPIHSVTGSGNVAIEGITFRTTIAAFKNENDTAHGWAVSNADLTTIGLGKITFLGRVTCLHVNGNSAWVSAVVTHSTDEEIIPVGGLFITLVRDLGGNGEDIMHSEFFDPSVDCASEPPGLAETVVINGDFRVR